MHRLIHAFTWLILCSTSSSCVLLDTGTKDARRCDREEPCPRGSLCVGGFCMGEIGGDPADVDAGDASLETDIRADHPSADRVADADLGDGDAGGDLNVECQPNQMFGCKIPEDTTRPM